MSTVGPTTVQRSGGAFGCGNDSSVVSSSATGTAAGTTVTVGERPFKAHQCMQQRESNSLNSSQSLFMTQPKSFAHQKAAKSSSSGGTALFNSVSLLQKQEEPEFAGASALVSSSANYTEVFI